MQKYISGFLTLVTAVLPLQVFATETTRQLSHTLSPAYFIKLGFALILVLAMFMGFAWLMRRFNGYQSSAEGGLRVVTGLNLGTREKLVVVQVGDDQLLLGVTPGKIEKIHRLETALDENTAGANNEFSRKLKSVLQKKEK